MINGQVKVFLCAADCGSFNKAASKLHLSPPSVMKQVNALEERLGVRLFDRRRDGVVLTAAGQVLYRHGKYLLSYAEKAVAEAKAREGLAAETFRVGSSLLNPCKVFMDLWYDVNEAFPAYRLNIVPFDDAHTGILAEIEALGDKYDFLAAACDSAGWLERCRFLRLGAYKVCCAMAREHPLAEKDRLAVEDLHGRTLLMGKRGDSPAIDALRDDLERHHEDIVIEDTPYFYDMTVFNRCAGTEKIMLTLECWKDVHPGLKTVPVAWEYTVPYGILYAKDAKPAVLRVVALIRDLMKQRGSGEAGA